MSEYCENPYCENHAVREVPVSVEEPSDQVRALCGACEEAYAWAWPRGAVLSQASESTKA